MLQEFKLGKLVLKNNCFSAPLAGISDSPYRMLLSEAGVGMLYSEMISAAGLSRMHKKTLSLLRIDPKEAPVAIQLFGTKLDEFAKSVEILNEKFPAAVIDINMGCPMKKVVQNGSGSALMKNPQLAEDIIMTVVKYTEKPVTVKFRSGWDDKNLNYLDFGKMAEQAGASAICLHSRTRAQVYTGSANWDQIRELAQAVKIPVIGSGDIKNPADFHRMLETTGCAAAMIGRAAMGNPWLIKSIVTGQNIEPAIPERIAEYLRHARLHIKKYTDNNKDEKYSIHDMRKFAHRYISGFAGASELRQKINKIDTLTDLEKLFC